MAEDRRIPGWDAKFVEVGPYRHRTFERGTGPGVILLPELPGISPDMVRLGEFLAERKFTVVMLSLFGTPGRTSTAAGRSLMALRLCMMAEFRALAVGAKRPATSVIIKLAHELFARTNGPVGVIGMCFTGGFALAAAVDPAIAAPVMSQPSVPYALGWKRRQDPGMSDDELRDVATRTRDDGLCALGLRFSEDRTSRRERLDKLKMRLGDALEVIELDSWAANPDGFALSAHSVLTGEVRESPPNAAFEAREKVVAFLSSRLAPSRA